MSEALLRDFERRGPGVVRRRSGTGGTGGTGGKGGNGSGAEAERDGANAAKKTTKRGSAKSRGGGHNR
jgi:hypothetical protein